jgi:hypothetical protein
MKIHGVASLLAESHYRTPAVLSGGKIVVAGGYTGMIVSETRRWFTARR